MKTLPILFVVLVCACSGQAGGNGGIPSLGGSSGTQGPGAASSTPRILAASARAVGRTGGDVELTLSGDDSDGDVNAVFVRFVGPGGMPVAAYDLDHNGALDAEGTLVLAQPPTSSPAFSLTLRLAHAATGVAAMTVALVDAAARQSEGTLVNVTVQPQRPLGDPCDPLLLSDRCAPGLGCHGTPSTCHDGQAPQITKAAYLRGSAGPTILLAGTEVDEDLASIHMEFLNAQDQPVMVDLDGDDAPDATSFDHDALGTVLDGAFFLSIQAADTFALDVPRLAITAMDGAGHVSAVVKVSLGNVPVRSAGQACDIRGFDACSAALVCLQSTGAATTCQDSHAARSSQCAHAPVLDPAGGVMAVSGNVTSGSLWDAPAGCISGDPVGRPDGAVVLRLAQPATRVVLTTQLPGTDFDTSLYLLPGCGADGTPPLGCNDDVPGTGASTLELSNVAAGNYLVVVDSFLAGGHFVLGVTVE